MPKNQRRAAAMKRRAAAMTPEQRRAAAAPAIRGTRLRRVLRRIEDAREIIEVDLGGRIVVDDLDAAIERLLDRIEAERHQRTDQ